MSVQGEKLKAIADAIREKKGTSEPIKANDFASEILSIQSGIEPSGTIDITENGTYDVTEYASANVNVSGGAGGEYNIEVTLNEDGTQNLIISDAGESGGGGNSKLAEYVSGTLTKITEEDLSGATAISGYMFYDNSNLQHLEIPSTINAIDSYSVYRLPSLNYLKWNVKDASVVSGITYDVFRFLGTEGNEFTFELGENVERFSFIGANAGYTDIYATKLILNKDLKQLDDYPFARMPNVKEVDYNCENDVTVPSNINYTAFKYCGKNTTNGVTLNIGENVSVLPDNIFYYFEALKEVNFLGDKITKMGENAFSNCTSLTNIVLPKNIERIENYTFYYCKGLTSITLPLNLLSIEESAFNNCTSLTSIEIPASVTSIGSTAFTNCTSLTKVVYKGQAPNINNMTYWNCTAVTLYDFRNCTSIPTLLDTYAITYASGCQIVVPDNLYDTWTTATNWSALTDVVWVKASEYVEV